MNILVTGANGFVGRALIERLLDEGHSVTALVRSLAKTDKKRKGITWLEGDLLRPEALPELKNIERAYYLVHGLKGKDGSFEYHESLAAVNFINWLKPTKTTVIYLGGLGEGNLSPHLRSRQLVGAILGAGLLPVIEFRASIILGEGSLSFEIIKALSERFPVRPQMPLLDQPCQPLGLTDLLNYLVSALGLKPQGHEIYEIGGPDVLTYGELLDLYSELAGLRRMKIKVPELETKVLTKLVDYAIPEHAETGKKLTESLEFPTVVTNNRAEEAFPEIHPVEASVAMEQARSRSRSKYSPIWEKDFLRILLSDKILTQSGLFSPELLKNLEKVSKFKSILARK